MKGFEDLQDSAPSLARDDHFAFLFWMVDIRKPIQPAIGSDYASPYSPFS